MENLRVQLRLVFYKDAGFWVAHCLEMDVMGHARTKREAFRRMNEAIAIQIAQSIKHDNRANIFMPADAKYFEMYSAGKDVATRELKLKTRTVKSSKPGKAPALLQLTNVVIQDIEAREYARA